MAVTSSGVIRRVQDRLPSVPGGAARDQAVVAAGQVTAGVGNMAFALVMARFLVPGAFAQLASFLALYSLLSLPGSSISAVASLTPERSGRARPVTVGGGIAAGVTLAVGAPWIGPLLHLPVAMVVVLGLSAPALGTLALERGCLYGVRGHRRLVASLVAEPALRLTVGVLLAAGLGAVGGAFGVVVAGYGALEIARRVHGLTSGSTATAGMVGAGGATVNGALLGEPELPAPPPQTPVLSFQPPARSLTGEPPEPLRPGAAGGVRQLVASRTAMAWTAVVFLLLTVVQNQDLLIANRVLAPTAAGQFAVLSTLGGMAAFATLTVPLVLLPRAARGDGSGLLPALGLAGLIGGVIVALAAAVPGELVGALFGTRYRAVAGVVAPYMLAMALLGVARVLAAHRCARLGGRAVGTVAASAAALQVVLILEFGHDPTAIALSTLTATSVLTVALTTLVVVHAPTVRRRVSGAATALAGEVPAALARCRRALARPDMRVLAAVCVVGIAVRFVVPRGLWLDEATSVHQATMSFGGMIKDLRTTDVHPPLYFSVLWATVRVLGTGQLAVRVPSIIAGSLTIPVLYLLGKEAYDRRTGTVAAAIGAVGPILVWYSQEARMYSMLALFSLLSVWAQVRIVKRDPATVGVLPWVVYALATGAMVWTQYFGLLQVVIQQLAFAWVVFVRMRRGQEVRTLLLGWFSSGAVVLLFLLPLMPFAFHQFVVNQNAGKGFGAPQQVGCSASVCGSHIGVYTVLANAIWAVIGYQPTPTMLLLGALWPLGMLLALGLLGRRSQPVTMLLVAAVLGPGLLAFGLGVFKPYLFDIRYLFPAVVLVTVLLARGITGFLKHPKAVVAATLSVMLVLSVFLVNQQGNGSNPRRYNFNVALSTIDHQDHHGDVLLYSPGDLNLLVGYYSPHVTAAALTSRPTLPTNHHTVWVLVTRSLQGPQDRRALARGLKYLRRHSRLVGRRHYANVEVWIFK